MKLYISSGSFKEVIMADNRDSAMRAFFDRSIERLSVHKLSMIYHKQKDKLRWWSVFRISEVGFGRPNGEGVCGSVPDEARKLGYDLKTIGYDAGEVKAYQEKLLKAYQEKLLESKEDGDEYEVD